MERLHISALVLDKLYTDVVLVITSDTNDVEITLNINQTQFIDADFKKLKAIFDRIKTKYNLKSIFIGEENAATYNKL